MRKFLLLLCLAMPLSAQEKSYDLSMEFPPKAGQKVRLVESSQMKMMMTLNDTVVPASDERKIFEATEVVVSADANGNAETHRTYDKAQRLEMGVMKPYGFQGKSVRVTKVKDQPATFAYLDGSEIAAEDLKALKGSFSGGGKDDDDDDSNPLKPPARMRVGESWTPDVIAVARMIDEEMVESVDVSKSNARFTLTSVEKRKGIEFGRMEGMITLALGKMGPLTFDAPVMMRFRFDIDGCIDGKLPDGVMKMAMRMRGTSAASVEGRRVNIDLDMTANSDVSKTSVK